MNVRQGAADDFMLGECAAATAAQFGGPDREIHPGYYLGISALAFTVTCSFRWWAIGKGKDKATPDPGGHGANGTRPRPFAKKEAHAASPDQ